MEKFIISGGKPLMGELEIKGAKNAVLPLLAGSIMCEGKSRFYNVPNILDVSSMLKILEQIGCKTTFEKGIIEIDNTNMSNHEIPDSLSKSLRSSIFIMGSVLAKFKRAKVAYPGGCDIGLRPINLHLEGLKAIGVKIKEERGYIICDGSKMRGGTVVLDFPSVGATENLMMAGSLIKGKTIIKNAAREPEIVDLANYLNKMGGKVSGAGKSTVVIDGVEKLYPIEYTPIPDRIVAGTYLLAAAMTGGEICVKNVCSEHIYTLLSKMTESTCKIHTKSDRIILKSSKAPISVKNIMTSPYPAFPTDLQAQMMAYMTVAKGVSIFEENMFETRYRHVAELNKMGADITVRGRTAVVKGVSHLSANELTCFDLRGGAAMLMAALAAEGESVISDVFHVDRGYEQIENDLTILGASIRRIGEQ